MLIRFRTSKVLIPLRLVTSNECKIPSQYKAQRRRSKNYEMGAASSTESHSAKVLQFRQTVLDGKPLDASDIMVCVFW